MTELWWVVITMAGLSLVAVAMLLVLRIGAGLLDRRRAVERAVTRQLVMAIVMGDEAESAAAVATFDALGRRARHRAMAQVFGLLPKVSGDVRIRLVELLRERGGLEEARRLLDSWSSTRRSRGGYRLGALRDAESVDGLISLLEDRAPIVRRVALRALGMIGDPVAVPAILATCANDRTLTRDVVASLQRIGTAGTSALRDHLAAGLEQGPDVSTELAAVSLGIVGDHVAVPVLVTALDAEVASLQSAAAEALGRIGTPSAVGPLVEGLSNESGQVRRASARALGEIGEPRAAEGLGQALESADRTTSRLIAAALLSLGETGEQVLMASDSPYAVEALAVKRLRAAPA